MLHPFTLKALQSRDTRDDTDRWPCGKKWIINRAAAVRSEKKIRSDWNGVIPIKQKIEQLFG